MDPHQFDQWVRSLGFAQSRRDTLRRSLAGVMAVVLGGERPVSAARTKGKCLARGIRCGAKKEPPCSRCCSGRVVRRGQGAKTAKRCGCRGLLQPCANGNQCCSAQCGDGLCRAAPCASQGQSCASLACCTGFCGDGLCRPAACQQLGQDCEAGGDCCSGVCDVTLPPPNACVVCLAQAAVCDPLNPKCCGGLTCQAGTCQPPPP